MTAPYLFRLLCLCLASFFALHLVLTALVAAIAGRALRIAETFAPHAGARLLLLLRLLPLLAAAVLVSGICAPSYLWLEPEATTEHMGLACLAAALLGGWVCAAGLARAARAVLRSSRYLRDCRSLADSDAPVLMLAGVFRPRLLVSRGVRRSLEKDQLVAALRHEGAHRASHDNLKRLLLLAAPEALPFRHGLRRLDRGWARMAEWAADDRAAAGDPRRSLALAAALVRVARMGAAPAAAPLATSLMADDSDLGVRVDRLLNPPAYRNVTVPAVPVALMIVALVVLFCQPATLYAAHRILEELMH